jgi:tricorn protease-like protein
VTSLKQPPFDGRSLYTEMSEVWKYALAATSLKELIFYLGVVLREMSPNGVYIVRNARVLVVQ